MPDGFTPFRPMLRKTTRSFAPALTVNALTPGGATTEVTSALPASTVIACVMVRDPYGPGSTVSISPPTAVLLYAPANVLHGDPRVHVFASFPKSATHVRVACA